jgi:hypothetical protein
MPPVRHDSDITNSAPNRLGTSGGLATENPSPKIAAGANTTGTTIAFKIHQPRRRQRSA